MSRRSHLHIGSLPILLALGATIGCGEQRGEPDLGPADDALGVDEDGREHHPGRLGIVSTDASGRDVTPGERVVTGRIAVAEDGSVELENADRDHDGRLDALEADPPADEPLPEAPIDPLEQVDPESLPYAPR
jgi:hypothetical protein